MVDRSPLPDGPVAERVPGRILIKGCAPQPCEVFFFARSDIRVKVTSLLGIPDRFRLVLPETSEIAEVEVVWRRPGELRVTVTSGATEPADMADM